MISVTNVTKNFGPKTAVSSLSFEVKKGQVLGFLGPNGAGKSTTMRMITGYIPPSSGKITVGGFDIETQPIKAKALLGYLPENAPSYADMTVADFLSFSAEIRGLSGDSRRHAVQRAIDLCFLEPVRHQSIDTLSKGFRHRTCLAQSVIHDPEVLILDEPTDGLDPNQKHEIRTLIRKMGETKAIIFSTHILEEVEAVCTSAIIIDRGRIVASGTPAELKSRATQAGALLATFKVPDPEAALREIRSLPEVKSAELLTAPAATPARYQINGKKTGQPRDESLSASVSALAARKSWPLLELAFQEGRLDEVFRTITLPETSKK